MDEQSVADSEIRGVRFRGPAPIAKTGDCGIIGGVKLLYLEDDPRDVELLQMLCEQEAPDCEITPVMDRKTFIAALQSGHHEGILSDSAVFDLAGPEAVKLARSLAPKLPYVFFCGTMTQARRGELLSANPDGMFSKDHPEHLGDAIALLRKLRGR
ncbi:MAG: multi-sensor hybrid histidine kinase [Lacunisphaera sp.]|nr:multi-sensor hybrid histidine kinase [Lacunisphaera sp.]